MKERGRQKEGRGKGRVCSGIGLGGGGDLFTLVVKAVLLHGEICGDKKK